MNVDLAIVGAGPAGTAAAITAARLQFTARPVSIVLIDKAIFPRSKVCGSCLSPAGVAIANRLGVQQILATQGLPIESVSLDTGSRLAAMPVTTGGVAIERSILDEALCEQARACGVTILQGTHAAIKSLDCSGAVITLTPSTTRSIPSSDTARELRAKLVIAADGLGSSLDDPQQPQPAKVWIRSRVGLGCILDRSLADQHLAWLPAGRMHMLTSSHGYIGLVKLRDGRADLAAAVDPAFIRQIGSTSQAIAAILSTSPRTKPLTEDLAHCTFKGVPTLTRARAAQQHVLLRAGDSLQYAEPFTGEGMSWAMQAGVLAGEHAHRIVHNAATPSQWPIIVKQALSRRRARCMLLTRLLRVPVAVNLAAWSIEHTPVISRGLLALLGGPWGSDTDAIDAHKSSSSKPAITPQASPASSPSASAATS